MAVNFQFYCENNVAVLSTHISGSQYLTNAQNYVHTREQRLTPSYPRILQFASQNIRGFNAPLHSKQSYRFDYQLPASVLHALRLLDTTCARLCVVSSKSRRSGESEVDF